MRYERLTLALAIAGCNPVFDLQRTELLDGRPAILDAPIEYPDRDRDAIPDPEDPCIASIADLKIDWDGDAYPNESDGCPFDYESVDTDQDGIYDECDPLPSLDGDRRRCIMAFQNPSINRELWLPRTGDEAAWGLLALNGLIGNGTGTLVAAESIEAPATTSYDVSIYAGNPIPPATDASVTFWIRAGTTAAATDVGCEIRGNDTTSELRFHGAVSAPVTIPRRMLGQWKLFVTIEPSVSGRANVRCTASHDFVTRTVIAREVTIPAGRVGLSVRDAQVSVGGLIVIERDDAPVLE